MPKPRFASKTYWKIYAPALIVAVVAFVLAYQFVGPPPPKTFRIASGPKSGAYYRHATQYAEWLTRHGITAEVVVSAGSTENLSLLRDENARVDVAFVQGGIDGGSEDGLMSLASLYFEPLWVFLRAGDPTSVLGELKGKRLAVGEEGSGTRVLALRLLSENGVDATNAELHALAGGESADQLLAGGLDAVFMVSSATGSVVQRLLQEDSVRALSFARAEGYARRFRFLFSVRLPRGMVDFRNDRPREDVELVAPAATLVARSDFHPALVDLLLQAAASVHEAGGVFEDPGLFPSARFLVFPLSRDADRYFEYGPPLLQRFLPFWLATLVDRLKVMLLPMLVLLIPIFKLVPPTLRWKIRRNIIKWYRQLHALDLQLASDSPPGNLASLREELNGIEREVAHVSVPLGYADQLYNLRLHLDLVRLKMDRLDA